MGDGRFWASVATHNPKTMPHALQLAGPCPTPYVLTENMPRSMDFLQEEVEDLALSVFQPERHNVVHVDRYIAAFMHLDVILKKCRDSKLEKLERLILKAHNSTHTDEMAL